MWTWCYRALLAPSIWSPEEAHAFCGNWRPNYASCPSLVCRMRAVVPLETSYGPTEVPFQQEIEDLGAFRDPQAKVNTGGCDGELVVLFLGFCIVGSLTVSTSDFVRKQPEPSIETLRFPIFLEAWDLTRMITYSLATAFYWFSRCDVQLSSPSYILKYLPPALQLLHLQPC